MASQTFQYAYVITGGIGTPTLTLAAPSGPEAFEIIERADDGDGINSSTAFGNEVDFVSNGSPAIQLTFVAISDTGDPVLTNGSSLSILYSNDPALGASVNLTSPAVLLYCFARDTQISTQDGAVAVQSLAIGDHVTTADGQSVPVKWIGHQTVLPFFAPHERLTMVRLRAGALGAGLPVRDLKLTTDHALLIDGLLINAGALVNGYSIDWVPLSELGDGFTVYHVETENHDIILAEGAPSETFVDHATRQAFDNYQEYVDLYGVEPAITELPHIRVSAQRLLPDAIKARLGIGQDVAKADELLRA